MGWSISEDFGEYVAEAGDFLWGDPVENTVALTVIENLRTRGAGAYGGSVALFGWWRDEAGRVCGAFHYTPPMPVLASSMPAEAARRLADQLASRVSHLPGINAEQTIAHAFAGAWQSLTGVDHQVTMNQRLHRLDRLQPPEPPPPGAARRAATSDVELLVSLLEGFERDIGVPAAVSEVLVADQIAYGGFVIWEADGEPMSVAGRTRIVADTARISSVYTPAKHRRKGFAAAVTATIAQNARDAGAGEVVLYTDLANPTSNGVYQRIGFRPVSDRQLLTFTATRGLHVPPGASAE